MQSITSERNDAVMPRARRWKWWSILRVVALSIVVVLVVFLLTPVGRYLARAGWEEAKILSGRRLIAELVSDSTIDAGVRRKLELVLAARQFAAESLALDAGESFTMFTQLRRDTLLLLLSAARRDALVPHTWWFPIVGRVPYKGYFDFEAAREAAAELEAEGYDTYLRPASAFSTLGWFNDPLLSTTLRQDSLSLANTVIHEITHNEFYAAGQAVFNESFASFVGARGAAWLFRTRGDTGAAELVDARWEDDKILARFWRDLYAELDSAFRAHPDDRDARLAMRDTIYERARERLRGEIVPKLRTIGPSYADRVVLDNAALLARRVYMTDLDVYDAVLARERGNVLAAVDRIIGLAKGREGEPFEALRQWVADRDRKIDSTSSR